MDYPERAERLAALDGVPIVEALERADTRFATRWWHWFFFGVAEKPERCPTLCLWSEFDDLEALYGDVLSVWRPWTNDLQGHSIKSGHHMAEKAPDGLTAGLARFLGEAAAAQ